MAFPAFFDQAPTLRLHDGLAQLLGASDDGILEYRYADAVMLAGHSCPTVAGAWLAARAGLRALYGGEMPERGGITVELEAGEDGGVTGVVAQVLTLVTGAAARNGFKGLGGRHARNDLLHYAVEGLSGIRFRRNDIGHAVEVEIDSGSIPADPRQRPLLQAVLSGSASAWQYREFGRLWQDRVRRMLLEHADDPAVVRVRAVR